MPLLLMSVKQELRKKENPTILVKSKTSTIQVDSKTSTGFGPAHVPTKRVEDNDSAKPFKLRDCELAVRELQVWSTQEACQVSPSYRRKGGTQCRLSPS